MAFNEHLLYISLSSVGVKVISQRACNPILRILAFTFKYNSIVLLILSGGVTWYDVYFLKISLVMERVD